MLNHLPPQNHCKWLFFFVGIIVHLLFKTQKLVLPLCIKCDLESLEIMQPHIHIIKWQTAIYFKLMGSLFFLTQQSCKQCQKHWCLSDTWGVRFTLYDSVSSTHGRVMNAYDSRTFYRKYLFFFWYTPKPFLESFLIYSPCAHYNFCSPGRKEVKGFLLMIQEMWIKLLADGSHISFWNIL